MLLLKLNNEPTLLCQAVKGEIENQLTANNLTINQLPSEFQTIYQGLKSGTFNLAAQIQVAEQKLVQTIGTKGASKKLDDLETKIKSVLTSSNQAEKKD